MCSTWIWSGYVNILLLIACPVIKQHSFTATSILTDVDPGTGPIILDDVRCVGTETNIFDCPNSGIRVHNCIHAEDAGVACSGKIEVFTIYS